MPVRACNNSLTSHSVRSPQSIIEVLTSVANSINGCSTILEKNLLSLIYSLKVSSLIPLSPIGKTLYDSCLLILLFFPKI